MTEKERGTETEKIREREREREVVRAKKDGVRM